MNKFLFKNNILNQKLKDRFLSFFFSIVRFIRYVSYITIGDLMKNKFYLVGIKGLGMSICPA